MTLLLWPYIQATQSISIKTIANEILACLTLDCNSPFIADIFQMSLGLAF